MEDKSISVAFYARVSSDQQAQAGTIASQIAALEERIADDAGQLREELRFIDDGYSGSTLLRPALERLRDVAAAGGLDRLYVHSPDRLARKYAYQVLLVEELQRYGVQIVFLNHPLGDGPEASLLLQMQGMIAEYERAKIMKRSRRGKRHAARRGSVSAMTNAPFGYHYVPKHAGGGEAQYQVVLEEARVVREMFQWVAHEGCSMAEVAHRLNQKQIATRRQARSWSRSTVAKMLNNPTYKGSAMFGKTRLGPRRARLRAYRNCPEQPRRGRGIYRTSPAEQERIPVPAIVSEELFAEVQTRLEENRRRHRGQPRTERYLLQGLTVCQACGYAYCGGSCPKYYRCTGTDRYRFEGEAICSNRLVRCELLDAAVWQDVCSLLSDPQRVEAEYERRLQQPTGSSSEDGEQLDQRLSRLKQGIARLIDAYQEGLLEKSEFEPRIRQAKDRLQRLAEDAQRHAVERSQQAELRLVLGHLNAFRERLQQGLSDVDWSTRRKIIRSLIKRVEITPVDIRVIYRIAPASPFDSAPAGGPMQDCPMHRGANRGNLASTIVITTRSGPAPKCLVQCEFAQTSPRPLDQSQHKRITMVAMSIHPHAPLKSRPTSRGFEPLTFGSGVDGSWNHNNGSDEWDEATIGGAVKSAPPDAMSPVYSYVHPPAGGGYNTPPFEREIPVTQNSATIAAKIGV